MSVSSIFYHIRVIVIIERPKDSIFGKGKRKEKLIEVNVHWSLQLREK